MFHGPAGRFALLAFLVTVTIASADLPFHRRIVEGLTGECHAETSSAERIPTALPARLTSRGSTFAKKQHTGCLNLR
jgi:hypothetical protein